MSPKIDIDARWIVERQGRRFALYAGLLDAGHSAGLSRISTALIQAGSESNGEMWIVSAEVTVTAGVFSAMADASPANVSASMRTCLLRMAETRAKARALRDAVNAGALVSIEELPGDEGVEERRVVDRSTGEIAGPVRPSSSGPVRPVDSRPRPVGR